MQYCCHQALPQFRPIQFVNERISVVLHLFSLGVHSVQQGEKEVLGTDLQQELTFLNCFWLGEPPGLQAWKGLKNPTHVLQTKKVQPKFKGEKEQRKEVRV